jgi:hypothetical protein
MGQSIDVGELIRAKKNLAVRLPGRAIAAGHGSQSDGHFLPSGRAGVKQIV